MAAYIIGSITITDPDRYREYAKHTPRVIAEFGGRFLVRGGEKSILEGPPDARRVVVIEFADRKAAEAFYHSATYGKIRGIRESASEGSLMIVDGFDDRQWVAAVEESRKHA
jgi:uncharacterized protein (DUF1330 family)